MQSASTVGADEIAQMVFKRMMGRADTVSSARFYQETRHSYPIVLTEHIWLDRIPDDPTESDGVTVENTVEHSDTVVHLIQNLELEPRPGTKRSVWQAPSSSALSLVDAVPPFTNEAYQAAFRVEIAPHSSENWRDVFGLGMAMPLVDSAAGLLRFYEPQALNTIVPEFATTPNIPRVRVSFYRYVGRKGTNIEAFQNVLMSKPYPVTPPFEGPVVSSQTITLRSLDVELRNRMQDVPWTTLRAPFVLTQRVKFDATYADLSNQSFEFSFDTEQLGLMSSVVIDRRQKRSNAADPPAPYTTVSGAEMHIYLDDPRILGVVNLDIRNFNHASNLGSGLATKLAATFLAPSAGESQLEILSIDIGLNEADPSKHEIVADVSGSVAEIQLTVGPQGGYGSLALQTPIESPTVAPLGTHLAGAAEYRWLVSGMVPFALYTVAVRATNDVGFAVDSAVDPVYEFEPAPSATLPLLDAAQLRVVGTDLADGALKDTGLTPTYVGLIAPGATDVQVRLSEPVRLNAALLNNPVPSSFHITLDGTQAAIVYNDSTGLWQIESTSYTFGNANRSGAVPAGYISNQPAEEPFPLNLNTSVNPLPGDTREVSLSVELNGATLTSQNTRIGVDSIDAPPLLGLDYSVAASLSGDVATVGGKAVVSPSTRLSVSIDEADVLIGDFLALNRIIGTLTISGPWSAGAVPVDVLYDGNLNDITATTWHGDVALSSFWPPGSFPSTSGVTPLEFVLQVRNPWGDSDPIAAVPTGGPYFIDQDALDTLGAWNDMRTVAIDAEARPISGTEGWTSLATEYSPVLVDGAARVRTDAAASGLQGFVATFTDIPVGAEFVVELEGSITTPEIVLQQPSTIEDYNLLVQVYVWASASDPTAGIPELVQLDGNSWFGGPSNGSCLAIDEADKVSYNHRRYMLLSTAYSDTSQTKTIRIGVVLDKTRHAAVGITGLRLTTPHNNATYLPRGNNPAYQIIAPAPLMGSSSAFPSMTMTAPTPEYTALTPQTIVERSESLLKRYRVLSRKVQHAKATASVVTPPAPAEQLPTAGKMRTRKAQRWKLT